MLTLCESQAAPYSGILLAGKEGTFQVLEIRAAVPSILVNTQLELLVCQKVSLLDQIAKTLIGEVSCHSQGCHNICGIIFQKVPRDIQGKK